MEVCLRTILQTTNGKHGFDFAFDVLNTFMEFEFWRGAWGAAAFLFVCKRYFPDFSAFVSVVGLNWKAADVGNGLPVRVVELRV